MHIGIAGAGLLGRLLAWRLARAGHRVAVFDPASGPQARGAAGWTAAGMLSPIAELECATADLARLGWRSLDAWQTIVGLLPQPVDFRRQGSLLLAHGSDLGSAQRMLATLRAKAPAAEQPQHLQADELRAMEPAVHGPAHAWWLPGEGQIHTVQAMQALADAASGYGVQWHWNASVERLTPGCIHRRVDGVEHSESFDWVFDVRGTGARSASGVAGTADRDNTGGQRGTDAALPDIRGVRGELVWLHAPGVDLRRPLRLLHPRWRVYLVPRPGDVVLVGATEIEAEDRSPISVRSMLGLLSAAHSVLPELAEARLVHTETNLRPATPDNLPWLHTAPGITGINGLFRHGWLLAPALVDDALQAAGLVAPLPASSLAMAQAHAMSVPVPVSGLVSVPVSNSAAFVPGGITGLGRAPVGCPA